MHDGTFENLVIFFLAFSAGMLAAISYKLSKILKELRRAR